MLGEIGADSVKTWLLLNKIDRVDEAERARLADHYPNALMLSAKSSADVSALRDRLIEHFVGAMQEVEPTSVKSHQRVVVHMVHERTTVLSEDHHDEGTRFRVRAPQGVIDTLREALKVDAP